MAEPFNPNNIYYDPSTSPNYVEGPIALSAPDIQPQELLTLAGSGIGTTIPSEAYSRKMAEKISLGLGSSKGFAPDNAYQLISSGQEENLRIQLAAKMDQDRNDLIVRNAQQLAAYKGSPLTPEEWGALVDPWNKKTDPSSVIEDAYTKRYLNSPQEAYNLDKWFTFRKAQQEAAQDEQALRNVYGDTINKKQEIQTWLQKAKDASERQSFVGDVIDRTKDLSQIYTELKLRGRVFPEDGLFHEGILLGNNLQETGTRLFRLDLPEFKTRLKNAIEPLIDANPYAAVQYLQNLNGMTPNEILGQNALTGVLGVGLGGMPFKGIAFVKRQVTANYLNGVYSQIAKDMSLAGNPNPFEGKVNSQPHMSTPAAMAEATGDVEGAALRQMENNESLKAQGLNDPISEAQSQLLSYQRAVTEKLAQGDLGTASRELRTRIANAIDAFTSGFVDKRISMLKVDPLGKPLATEENRAIILDYLRDRFTGPNASINNLEFVDFNTDPSRGANYMHPVTNRAYIRYTIHNYDGTLFADEATARGFAETQLGLVDANLSTRFGPITSREMARKIARRDFIEEQISKTNDFINEQKKTFQNPETYVVAEGKKRFYTAGDGQLYSTLEEAKSKVPGAKEIKFLDLSEAQIKKLNGTLKDNATPSGFKTAKGSVYEIQENGTTIRNKKARPEHPGDSGVKPVSAKTVYITQEVAEAIAPPQGGKVAFVIHGDGKISLAQNIANNWGISKSAKELIYSTTPQVGSIPLELWNKSQIKGLDSFSRWHFGNKITSVSFDLKNANNFNPIKYTKEDAKAFKTLKGTEGTRHKEARSAIERYNKQLDNLYSERDRLSADIDQAGKAKYNVQQHGMGFQITYDAPLDQSMNVVTSLMVRDKAGRLVEEATTNHTGFTGIARGIFGKWLTPNNVLSKEEVRQRIIAETAPNAMYQYLKQGEKYINDVLRGRIKYDPITGAKLSAWEWVPRSILGKVTQRTAAKQFSETIDFAKTAPNPDTGGLGYWFKTMGELEAHYMQNYGRPPSATEHWAYHMFKTLHETDAITRTIIERQNKEGRGAEQFKIFMNGENKERLGSEFFEGTQHHKLPAGEGQILVIGPTKGSETVHTIGSPQWTALRPKLAENVESGKGMVIQLWDRDRMPLGNFSDVANGKRIQWIYTENGYHRKPLSWDQVERVEGGHWDYNYGHYIKQPIMEAEGSIADPNDRSKMRFSYVNDQTLMPIANRKQGQNISKMLNDARIALRNGDEVKAQLKLAPTGIPYDRFKTWFQETVSSDGVKKPASFSLHDDFMVVPKGRKAIDVDTSFISKYKRMGKTSLDQADNEVYEAFNKGSPANQFQVEWNRQRNEDLAYTIEDTSWFGKPVYEYRPAKLESTIDTTSRTLSKAVNSLWMNDYKEYAINHWIQEVKPLIDLPERELLASPRYYYHTLGEAQFKSGIPATTKAHFLDMRDKQRVFMGTPSTVDTYMQTVAQWAADSLYEHVGAKPALIPEWLYSHVEKPVDYVRAFAFNVKLGLFSPVNFLVQGQTFTNIAAFEPKLAPKGMAGLYFYWNAAENASPEVLKLLDAKAVKMGWRPGEFIESLTMLRNNGWENIGQSHASATGNLSKDFFRSDAKGLLDAGQATFRLSEKAPRIASYFTSYLRWREANPTAKMTAKAEQEILQYADDLTFNMTRASSSKLHTGMFSLTNQFLAYQFRMIELMTSKRLQGDGVDRALTRARLVGTYWAMYGSPAAITTTALGIPVGTMYKDYMIANGYQPGDNVLETLWMEGLVNTGIGFISGKGDMSKGKWLNWGDRLGPQGFTSVAELLRTDGNFLKVLGGAGLNTIYETYKSADGLLASISDMIRGVTKDKHAFRSEDLTDPLRVTTTGNQTMKLITALKTGYWSNKNEGLTEKTSPMAAFSQALSGLEPASQGQMFSMAGISKDWANAAKDNLKKAQIEYQRALTLGANNDRAGYDEYISRTYHWLNMANVNENHRRQFFSEASKGHETLLSRVYENFYTNRNMPDDKVQALTDTYRRILNKERN